VQFSKAVCVVPFRVLQEALSNVARHSGPDRVTVFVSTDDKGLGLVSTCWRLRFVGGSISVTSSELLNSHGK
jgi:hypothetical protein